MKCTICRSSAPEMRDLSNFNEKTQKAYSRYFEKHWWCDDCVNGKMEELSDLLFAIGLSLSFSETRKIETMLSELEKWTEIDKKELSKPLTGFATRNISG